MHAWAIWMYIRGVIGIGSESCDWILPKKIIFSCDLPEFRTGMPPINLTIPLNKFLIQEHEYLPNLINHLTCSKLTASLSET